MDTDAFQVRRQLGKQLINVLMCMTHQKKANNYSVKYSFHHHSGEKAKNKLVFVFTNGVIHLNKPGTGKR